MLRGNFGDVDLETGNAEIDASCPEITTIDLDIVVWLTRNQAVGREPSPCWDCANAMSSLCGKCQNYDYYQPET